MSSDPESKGTTRTKRCSYKDQYFVKWVNESTIHGVDHVFKKDGKSLLRRLVWFIVLAVAIGAMLYFIIDRIAYFSKRPTATTVDVKVNRDGIPFPAVTVCNLNPISRSFVEAYNITPLLNYLFFTGIGGIPEYSTSFQSDACKNQLNRFEDDKVLNLPLRDIYFNGSHQFIQSCVYGDTFESTSCLDDSKPILTSSGLCYTFNSLDNGRGDKLVMTPGARFGLRMTVNISQDMYIASSSSSFLSAGVKISVHHRTALPEPEQSGINVPPGSHSSIGLYSHEFLSSPDISNCVPYNTDLEFFPGRLYTLSSCKANEFYKRSAETCNCTDISNPPTTGRYSNIRNCTLADVCCLYDAFIYSVAARSCLPSCNESFFVSSVSYSQYPTNRNAEGIMSFTNRDVDQLRSNLLSFNIFFGSIHTTQSVTEITYGSSALVADIGGQLALFIGASVISGIEVFFLLFDEIKRVILFFCRKVKKEPEEIEMKSTNSSNEKESDQEEMVSDKKTSEV